MSDLSEINLIEYIDQQPQRSDNYDDIIKGLTQSQKNLNPKYFYDTRGSKLFEQITQLPEYYPTRTERKILSDNATAIAAACGKDAVMIEPGSGSSEKVRLILDAIKPQAYVAIDIADEFLKQSAEQLALEYEWLDIYAICADFGQPLNLSTIPDSQRLIFYPGSTIGNMTPRQAVSFLSEMTNWLDEQGGLLIGVDKHKDSEILNAAYNDCQGVTADFNLNTLQNINKLVNADFNLENFSHHAFYNEQLNRIEMHLVSDCNQQVSINNNTINFHKGETIHTENSYKYTDEQLAELLAEAGFNITHSWSDEQNLFGVHLCQLK